MTTPGFSVSGLAGLQLDAAGPQSFAEPHVEAAGDERRDRPEGLGDLLAGFRLEHINEVAAHGLDLQVAGLDLGRLASLDLDAGPDPLLGNVTP